MPPITPAEAAALRQDSTPPEYVFKVINDLIVANLNKGGKARVARAAICAAIEFHPDYLAFNRPRPNISEIGWMNFEPYYRRQGWTVEFFPLRWVHRTTRSRVVDFFP